MVYLVIILNTIVILQFKFAIVANGRLTYITDEEFVMNLDELKTNGNPSMLLVSWSYYIIQYILPLLLCSQSIPPP